MSKVTVKAILEIRKQRILRERVRDSFPCNEREVIETKNEVNVFLKILRRS
jgi:hypothetical protein